MRTARQKEDGNACYHVISRVIDRRMLLDEEEKTRMMDLMRRTAGFCGVEVMTFAVLDNHFHLLLHIPQPQDISDEELIRRLGFLYGQGTVRKHARALGRLREVHDHEGADAYKQRFTYRMHDLSEYMKTFKQRFTQSYNRRHSRKGTLWEDRFKSILLQQPLDDRRNPSTMVTSAAEVGLYIDLNAVRAGMVDDPAGYGFCGYGQAVAGHEDARRGIVSIVSSIHPVADWATACENYSQMLGTRIVAPDGGAASAKPGECRAPCYRDAMTPQRPARTVSGWSECMLHGAGARTTRTRSPRGAHCTGSVGPNNTTDGVPSAAARCEMPESLPT